MEISLLAQSGVSVAGIAVILIIYKVLKVVNGKRIVSQCCGKKTEIGFQVENMTPTVSLAPATSSQATVTIDNPMLNRANNVV